jgi:putative tryptophan/tyrosine transport system substrate-binding protein
MGPRNDSVMHRRRFVAGAVGFTLAASRLAGAQSFARLYRLGFLALGTPLRPTSIPPWLAQGLRDLGYVEGQNLVVEARYADDKPERLPVLAGELSRLKLDVIVAIGTAAAQALKAVTTTIPVIVLTNTDPVAAGLVRSLARPEGNITGILIAPEGTLAGKKLELLKEAVPRATQMAMLVTDDPGIAPKQQIQETRKAAFRLGLELTIVEVRGGDYAAAFTEISAAHPAALFVGAHSRFVTDRKAIIDLAAKYRLPAIWEGSQQVEDGGLMSYGASDTQTYRRVAAYVDRVFKGAQPQDLPIEQSNKLLLVINVKTAKSLGLQLPESLLLRADRLIE